jgi:hypothetical protein
VVDALEDLITVDGVLMVEHTRNGDFLFQQFFQFLEGKAVEFDDLDGHVLG